MPDQIKILNPDGITKDISPYESPDDQWTDGNNVQFHWGKTHKPHGHKQALGDLSAEPYWLLPFTTPNDSFWIYPSLTKIYKTDGASDTNITKVFTSGVCSITEHDNKADCEGATPIAGEWTDDSYSATAAGGWNGGVLGGVAILNNGIDVPQMYGSSLSECVDLTDWNSDWSASIVRPFKQFLVALDMKEGSNRYPFRVRWSHPAESGTVPSTWDASDAARDAGYVDLSQTNGFLVDCLPLKDTNIIYKEDSVWGMAYEGGQSIFRFFEIFNDTGILGNRCVKAFDDKHFVVTSNDVYVHNGHTKESVIDNKMRVELFKSIHPEHYSKTFVAPNYRTDEMWICFVSGSNDTDAFADKAFVWNWRRNSWSIIDLPHVSHIGWGIIDSASGVNTWVEGVCSITEHDNKADCVGATPTAGVWTEEEGTWDNDAATWDFRGYNPSLTSMLMSSPDTTTPANSKLYEAEKTNKFDGTVFKSWVEKTGMNLGFPGMKSIKKIVPTITGTGTVDFYLGTEIKAGAGIAWKGPYKFIPGTHSEIPVRATGSFISIKIETTDDKTWALDKLEIHWTPSGARGSGV